MRDVINTGIKNKCHWWSGYDLFRRLLFYVVYLVFENFISDYTQVSEFIGTVFKILNLLQSDPVSLSIHGST